MSEANNNTVEPLTGSVDYSLNPDLSQILDPKSDRIQEHSEMPAPTDGHDGEIRLGVRFKNQVLMATKIDSEWYFSPMSTLSGLNKQDNQNNMQNVRRGRRPAKKGNILPEVFTGTTHASTGTWMESAASTKVTGDNIISMSCSILASSIWYAVSNTLLSVTDDPGYANLRFVESNKKFGIQTNTSVLQSLPFRAIIFYRNKNF